MARFTAIYVEKNHYYDSSFIKDFTPFLNEYNLDLVCLPFDKSTIPPVELDKLFMSVFPDDKQLAKDFFNILCHYDFSMLWTDLLFKCADLPPECEAALIVLDGRKLEKSFWERHQKAAVLLGNYFSKGCSEISYKEVFYADGVDGIFIEKYQAIVDLIAFILLSYKSSDLDFSPIINFHKGTIFYNRNSVLKIKKYYGHHVSDVIKVDFKYLKWCLLNLNHFYLETQLMSELFPNNIGFNDSENVIRKMKTNRNFFSKKTRQSIYQSKDKATYNDYNNSYAQSQEHISDQFIDDVLNGDPDAYWNID